MLGMDSDFDDEDAELAWMTQAGQGDRPPGWFLLPTATPIP